MEELTYDDYVKAHQEIKRAYEENADAFQLAALLHEQGVVTEKTKENVTKGSVLIWVLEHFKRYPAETKAENVN